MKIRIMGTKEELEVASSYYRSLEKEDYVKSVVVSRQYANRGSTTIFSLYIDIDYNDLFLLNPSKRKSLIEKL